MWAWSAWNKNSKVHKICTEPRAQWNHNNYINKHTTQCLSLHFKHKCTCTQMWARHSESRGEKMGITHTHTHGRVHMAHNCTQTCTQAGLAFRVQRRKDGYNTHTHTHSHTHTAVCTWRTTAHRHAHRQAWHLESRGEKTGLENRFKWYYGRRLSEGVG